MNLYLLLLYCQILLLENLGRALLPIDVSIPLQNTIAKYGNITNSLLHYVYSTEPMHGKIRGNLLDFKNLTRSEGKNIQAFPIGKKTIKKAKEILKRIKEKKPSNYSPPQGKFDDVYHREMKMLEGIKSTGQLKFRKVEVG